VYQKEQTFPFSQKEIYKKRLCSIQKAEHVGSRVTNSLGLLSTEGWLTVATTKGPEG
jgi:hypothetical protein